MSDPEWLIKYKRLNDLLTQYGWFVPPFLIGLEFERLERSVEHTFQNPSKTDEERRTHEKAIYMVLCDVVFRPAYRARGVWYGIQLAHFNGYSHLYESAVFAYYKRGYAAAILCSLAALEGVLLSFYGWSIQSGRRKPDLTTLILKVRSAKSPPVQQELVNGHDWFRDTLATFLERWIYRNTDDSDFSLSVLNRHYVLHGLEPGNFYRPEDVHRMVLLFDLLVEFFAHQQQVYHQFIPDEGQDPKLDKRRIYYTDLTDNNRTLKQCWETERELLKDHPRYVAPLHDPNLAESQLISIMDYLSVVAQTRKPSTPS